MKSGLIFRSESFQDHQVVPRSYHDIRGSVSSEHDFAFLASIERRFCENMSTTIAASTTSTATTDTSDVTALTTTFTPPARCTQASEMFSMLAPRSEIWANDPVPVSGSTVSSCYPSEWLADYTSTTKTTTFTGKATGMVSSIVPAMSPLVCPLRWETVLTAPGNYIACCPP